jgi:hypothetical protein
MKWKEIAKSFLSRSKAACTQRYQDHVKQGEDTTRWSKEEDHQLERLRGDDRMPWKEVAKFFPRRTVSTCQSRYCKYVNTGEKRAA